MNLLHFSFSLGFIGKGICVVVAKTWKKISGKNVCRLKIFKIRRLKKNLW